MDITSCLSRNPNLSSLPEAELEALAFAFTERSVADGEELVAVGKRGSSMHLLLEGDVSVAIEQGGKEIEIARLSPGGWFGLLALIDHAPASATCRARGPVRTATLSRTAFDLLSNRHASIAQAFQRAVGAQLASDTRRLIETAQ